MKKKLFSMLLVAAMLVLLLPVNVFAVEGDATLTVNAPATFEVGKAVEYTVTTTGGSLAGTMVYGDFTTSDMAAVEKIEYLESRDSKWYVLPANRFGPPAGFPLTDATSKFRVTFKEAGTYNFTINIKTVAGDTVLLTKDCTFTSVPPLNPDVSMTDCGHFDVSWGGEAAVFSAGWKYTDINYDTVTSIKVGMKDASGQMVMEYTADAQQIVWQKGNGYLTPAGFSSAPFYKEYNSTPISEARDNDWTAKKGPGFDLWEPSLFYVEVVADGVTYKDEMVYDYHYPHPDVSMTDCGHFDVNWSETADVFSMGWKYTDIDLDSIKSIRAWATDAQDRIVLEYTANEAQLAYQRENGYITAAGLSSVPFYKDYHGTPIAGVDDDWTARKGTGFEIWQPNHFWLEVTMSDGTTYTDDLAYDFDYPHIHEPVATAKKAATCEKDGNIAYWFCDGCGKYFSDEACTKEITKEQTVDKATGHDYTWLPVKAATCTEMGTEEGICKNCDDSVMRDIAALGHKLVQHEAKAPTCTEKGWDAYETCERCDHTTYKEKAPLGHKFGEWKVTKAAICTEDGTEERVCGTCGAKEARVIPAAGHKYGQWKITKAATCTEDGTEERVCGTCGAKEARVTPAAGHKYGQWKPAEDGKNHEKACACGDTVTEAHAWDKGVVTKKPTHEAEGVKTFTCSVCGATRTESIPKVIDSPNTGDNSLMLLWLGLVLLSGSAIAGITLYGKKRNVR